MTWEEIKSIIQSKRLGQMEKDKDEDACKQFGKLRKENEDY